MLQQLPPQPNTTPEVHRFIRDLLSSNFQGDIATDESSLAVASTDNSIWQTTPQAVIAPRTVEAVSHILELLSLDVHRAVSITPRGGGTSTAGQSLTNSVVLDCRTYLSRVLDFDPQSNQVHVECGAVLQSANDSLRGEGVMIGPTVATASRATIGGMIGNDSAGKGSRVYGKTSDCVVELETVLRGGVVWNSYAMDATSLDLIQQEQGVVGEIHHAVRSASESASPYLADHWPTLPRFVTGYNLPMAWDGNTCNLNRIFCGSEGTLGVTTTARLQCVPIPTNRHLLLLCFDSFDAALRCGATLTTHNPTAIEVIDDMVLETARNDASWLQIASLLGEVCDDIKAILFVEFSDAGSLRVHVRVHDALEDSKQANGILNSIIIHDTDEMNLAWSFRSRSVGLLSSLQGDRTPIPFVEDCAVPPEVLPEFIHDFRALLDNHDLRAGMFGHVDAGVIHVRPALDMQNSIDRDQVRLVSEEVSTLVREYRGVLWGEHGKGFRSEFGREIFGNEIWEQMCNVKGAFDPHNQLNPQKVAVSNVSISIASIDAPTRGEKDETVQRLPVLSQVTRCDGNSDCQSVATSQNMCPTYRATGDPIHSPRGRAEVLRHWLSRIGTQEVGKRDSFVRRFINSGGGSDYSHDVRAALDGCLSCKACATDCPMQIDISFIRSHFYQAYFGRYLRSLRDVAWLHMESFLPLLASRIGSVLPASLLASLVGIVDSPNIVSPPLSRRLNKRKITTSSPLEIVKENPSVALMQDSFTTFYRPSVFLAMIDILEHLNLSFSILPLRSCGKALHVRGALGKFHTIASRNTEWLAPIQHASIPIIGIDPAATLLWRDEYPRTLGVDANDNAPLLPQEWLISQDLSQIQMQKSWWRLFPHCIEKACVTNSNDLWKQVFSAMGATLHCVDTACCGMGGLFGHQKEHRDLSIKIWNMHWAEHEPNSVDALATGYSCFSQGKRANNSTLLHPIELIASALQLK